MASNRNGPVALRKPISTDFAVSIVRFGLPISKVAVASCAPRENSSAGFGARSTYCVVMLPTYIATLITEDQVFWGQLSAIGLLASLPVLAMVGVVQRALIMGFSGGVK